jgi:WD40 repeat protein
VTDDHKFVSCSYDSSVSVWKFDPDSKQVDHLFSLTGHVSGVKAVDVSDNMALTGSRDRSLRLWCLKTGDELTQNRISLAGSPSCVNFVWPHAFVGLKSSFFE